MIKLPRLKEEGTLRMITAGKLQKLIQRKVTTLVGYSLLIDAVPDSTSQIYKVTMP